MVSEKERVRKLRFTIGTKIRGQVLGEYYVSFRNWVPFIESGGYGPLDKDGIPLVHYSGDARMSGIGPVYFAITVAQYALGIFDLWLDTGLDKYRQKFMELARWLELHAEPVGDAALVWPAGFDFHVYGLDAPWISSMAQSQVASVLLRAYQVEKRNELREMAGKALATFYIPAGEPGGVRYVDGDGDVWFEEYVTDPPAHVLNGFIFSLFGLDEFARVTSDDAARQAWDEGLRTLERKLYLYDTGYWSRYDLLRDSVASTFYHGNVHVPLLRALHLVTGKSIFLDFADKWQEYLESTVCRFRARYYRLPSRVVRKLGGVVGGPK
ncbi:MAG: D-glucuronyl C5-epimerase family protein [Candidatus Eisenbacteria bacterium]|nr:D-glucuronyl C5-epimerase family protein [Candidatus Eisenbacteria bacterium]